MGYGSQRAVLFLFPWLAPSGIWIPGMPDSGYRGRLAPTPTGRLHLGHALTFRVAHDRCREKNGVLIYRNEDLDPDRCRPEFVTAAMDDLRWLGIDWDEGPGGGGRFGPYDQSARLDRYREAWETLRLRNVIYPCRCSRRDLQEAARAPHEAGGEAIYPGTCRPGGAGALAAGDWPVDAGQGGVCWRFRVIDGQDLSFEDGRLGSRTYQAGRDFGDFVIWRRDDVPAYELAVVVDDAAMKVTEVVRGADLLLSTARQCLIYRALGLALPAFHHTPLVGGPDGRRLAKRDQAASIGSLRDRGLSPDEVFAMARNSLIIESDTNE